MNEIPIENKLLCNFAEGGFEDDFVSKMVVGKNANFERCFDVFDGRFVVLFEYLEALRFLEVFYENSCKKLSTFLRKMGEFRLLLKTVVKPYQCF